MKATTILIIGILIGIATPYVVDQIMFDDPTPLNVTRQYEDGSGTFCMAGGLCND